MGQGPLTNTNNCYSFRACGWPALQTEYSKSFWFSGQHKGDGPAEIMWGMLLSAEKYNIKIDLVLAPG